MDIHAEITAQIITQLDQGVTPWSASWVKKTGLPTRSNGDPYTGINTLLLWGKAAGGGFAAPT